MNLIMKDNFDLSNEKLNTSESENSRMHNNKVSELNNLMKSLN